MPAPTPAQLAAQIRRRAEEVRQAGEWIGFFEFLIFAKLRGVRILMLVGEHVIDPLRLRR